MSSKPYEARVKVWRVVDVAGVRFGHVPSWLPWLGLQAHLVGDCVAQTAIEGKQRHLHWMVRVVRVQREILQRYQGPVSLMLNTTGKTPNYPTTTLLRGPSSVLDALGRPSNPQELHPHAQCFPSAYSGYDKVAAVGAKADVDIELHAGCNHDRQGGGADLADRQTS